MKNVMVANFQPGARVKLEQLRGLLDAQLENSLALGWKCENILLVTNFEYAYEGVIASVVELNRGCLRGSKMFAVDHLLRATSFAEDEILWAHDLDAWQNHWFEPPAFADIGIAEYSRPKFNGGSIFYRPAAADIVGEIVQVLRESAAQREEPTINEVLRRDMYRARVTTLNSTFNLGCSGFVVRYKRSTQPVLVSHLHPNNSIAWDTHVNDRNELGQSSMSTRLMELLVRRFHGGTPPKKLVRSPKSEAKGVR